MLKKHIQQLWLKKYYKNPYTIFDWLLIFILRPISFLYAIGFSIILQVKKLLALTFPSKRNFVSSQGECFKTFFEFNKGDSPAYPEEAKGRLEGQVVPKIISIGNLSVGGTGKTVMVEFLLDLLAPLKGGVVLRGYKNAAKTTKPILVSDGEQLFVSVAQCGDEAYMLAIQNKIPVVVGRDRWAACNLLFQENSIDYVLLDDAYQNVRMHRDLNILLIDSRYPLSQTTWFPAGFLREKDYIRADVIVLTHSQDLSSQQITAWYDELSLFNPKNIFFGEHVCSGFYLNNVGDDVVISLQQKRVLAIAGIGNISSFLETIQEQNVSVASMIDFGDHHVYTLCNMRKVIEQCRELNLDRVVMTSKDWYKCVEFIEILQEENVSTSFYVLRVQFEFLSEQQYDRFYNCIRNKLCVKTQ